MKPTHDRWMRLIPLLGQLCCQSKVENGGWTAHAPRGTEDKGVKDPCSTLVILCSYDLFLDFLGWLKHESKENFWLNLAMVPEGWLRDMYYRVSIAYIITHYR